MRYLETFFHALWGIVETSVKTGANLGIGPCERWQEWLQSSKTYPHAYLDPKALRLSEGFKEAKLDSSIIHGLVSQVEQGWNQLYAWSGYRLEVPKVAFDEEGCIFVWDTKDGYIEVEFRDGNVEYFSKCPNPVAIDFDDMTSFLQSPEARDLLVRYSGES